MRDLFANPARALCGAVLAMIGTFALAVWASGALERPPSAFTEISQPGDSRPFQEPCR